MSKWLLDSTQLSASETMTIGDGGWDGPSMSMCLKYIRLSPIASPVSGLEQMAI